MSRWWFRSVRLLLRPTRRRRTRPTAKLLLQVTHLTRERITLKSLNEDDRAASAAGDSGGPLFTYRGMHTLVGLISAGNDRQTSAVALVTYYGWIKETQEKLSGR